MYKYGGLYRIAVAGELRKRFSKWTTRFQAPYRTLLTGEILDLVVLVDLPPQSRKASPFELRVNPRSTDTSVLGELLLLDWHVALDSAWFAKKQVCQPLGVWIYEGGAVVAACLKGTARRPLKDWLRRSREQGDPQLVSRLSLQVRPPDVRRADRPGSFPQGKAFSTLSPMRTLYLFREASMGRMPPGTSREPRSAEQGYLERLPPSLRSACEGMDFGELRQFLDACMTGQENGPGAGCPRSEGEFLGLLEMLWEKIDKPRLPNVLPNPGAPPMFPEFEPSDHLSSLREEQGRLAAALTSAKTNPDASERSIRELKHRLRLAVRKRSALEDKERQEHAERRDARLRPYREAKAAYQASLRRREEALREHNELRSRRAEIAERVGRDIKRAFEPGAAPFAGRLPWRLLPPGELSIERLRLHYKGLQQRDPHIRYDPERIEKAFSLEPERCYVGTDQFDGYVVFTFARTERALLECPIYGNAIYVLGPDWRRLSKMSKQELLSGRLRGVDKIVHKGDWFSKVKMTLGIW